MPIFASSGIRTSFLAAALLLAGCHAERPVSVEAAKPDATGEVSYALLPSATEGQYQLKKDENAYGAVPITHDPPAYPAALIGKNLPSAVVRVKAIVDGEGRVTEVRDLDASPGPEHAAFFDACREAVAHWKFTPMTVVQEVEDKKGNITEVRRTAPFSLDYAFNFELVEGRPSVTAATDAGTSSVQ